MSYPLNPNTHKIGAHYGQKEPVKIYYTALEVSEITGMNIGLCYYYRGKYRREHKPSSPSQKFTVKELEYIKQNA